MGQRAYLGTRKHGGGMRSLRMKSKRNGSVSKDGTRQHWRVIENWRSEEHKSRRAKSKGKESTNVKFENEFDTEEGERNVFRIAKQMAKERQDVVGGSCLENDQGEIVTDGGQMKNV